MDTNKNFQRTIMDFAHKLQTETGTPCPFDIMSAAALVLATITRHAFDGTDHVPHPDRCTIEKSTVGACFMAACSVPIIYSLQEQNIPVDVNELMKNAGTRLFQEYSEADQCTIIDEGILLFQEIFSASRDNKKFEEWMASVHSVTDKYIMSKGDTEYVELFAPLYLVLLMAARQFTMQLQTNRES
ncbi:MAG: hypothetical protein JXM72_03685 [Deltaproteobacteria bacterium]|nr:hypothetical protein [Deltaproteobacteria bacterium]